MRVLTSLLVMVWLALVCGCSSDAAGVYTPPSPPGAEACPETFNACIELCQPRGVVDFACWSEQQGVEFRCECMDGSKPAESSEGFQLDGLGQRMAATSEMTTRAQDGVTRNHD